VNLQVLFQRPEVESMPLLDRLGPYELVEHGGRSLP
jgi:hypothetical protein